VVLLLVGGCSRAAPAVPYDLTVCPGPVGVPDPLPKLRTVEMVVAHDTGMTAALAVTERRRAACADTLRRLVEWVQGHG
jgi:hypothetical protein